MEGIGIDFITVNEIVDYEHPDFKKKCKRRFANPFKDYCIS